MSQLPANVPANAPPAPAQSGLIVDERPAFLAEYGGGETGLSFKAVRDKIVQSRLKIVQGQTKDENLQKAGVGSICITPELTVIASPEFNPEEKRMNPFSASVPFYILFVFKEFKIHNPYAPDSGLPYIRESTLSASHEIARHCMLRDKKLRQFPCPEVPGEFCEYAEHLTFIVCLDLPGWENFPLFLSCTSTNMAEAQNLIRLGDKRRNERGEAYPTFVGRYSMNTKSVTGKKGVYWTWNFENAGWNENPGLRNLYAAMQREAHMAWQENAIHTDEFDNNDGDNSRTIDGTANVSVDC